MLKSISAQRYDARYFGGEVALLASLLFKDIQEERTYGGLEPGALVLISLFRHLCGKFQQLSSYFATVLIETSIWICLTMIR